MLLVDLLDEKEESSEVACAKGGEVDDHPRKEKASLPSLQAKEGDEVEEEEDGNGEHLHGRHDHFLGFPSSSKSNPIQVYLHLCHQIEGDIVCCLKIPEFFDHKMDDFLL